MSRLEVLRMFKSLQRVVQTTFQGDSFAISEARKKIIAEFKKETKENELADKLKIASEVREILQKQVVQAVRKPNSDKFELKLRKETAKLDNVIFKDDAALPQFKGKKCKPDKT